jgi:hypothetical protein
MRVIGLDLGTQCGYAWTETGEVVGAQTGAWDFRAKRFEGGGFRYLRFGEALRELTFMRSDECCVFFEEVGYHRGADAAHVYGAFYGKLQEVCDSAGIPYRGIPIGTIKRRATNHGRANKEDMIRAAFHEWSVRMTDDQADAAWVLQCGLDEIAHTATPEPEDEQRWA